MKKTKSTTIEVQGTAIAILSGKESVFNPDFNYGEFTIIRSQAGLNSYRTAQAAESNRHSPDENSHRLFSDALPSSGEKGASTRLKPGSGALGVIMSKEQKLRIRNSTAEFLIFARQAGEDGIEVRVAEETVWLTQKLIGVLFDKGRSTITEHLSNIFEAGELDEKAVCRDFRHTAEDGKDYTTRFYNLDAIIAVGFRVNSSRAIQFRQWATGVLRDSPKASSNNIASYRTGYSNPTSTGA